MRVYDVEVQDRQGRCRRRMTFPASEPWMAVEQAKAVHELRPLDHTMVVFALRRLRRRRALLTVGVNGPDGPGDGAGVREPRRPKPDPDHLVAEADLP